MIGRQMLDLPVVRIEVESDLTKIRRIKMTEMNKIFHKKSLTEEHEDEVIKMVHSLRMMHLPKNVLLCYDAQKTPKVRDRSLEKNACGEMRANKMSKQY